MRLEHALANFERAPILTIHAFCNRVLTEFAFHSGARFDLDLVDGRRAFRTTFRAMLRECFAVDPLMRPALEVRLQADSIDNIDNLERLCSKRIAADIRESTTRRRSIWCSVPSPPGNR